MLRTDFFAFAAFQTFDGMPDSGGLSRNIRQCLQDFKIPIRTGETVCGINGRGRLKSVAACRVDEKMQPVPGSEYEIPCDLLVLSVGLIPENELAREAGITLDEKTNNVQTDAFLQTNIPGIFSCGNSRKVHDLADHVTAEGIAAGRNAANFVLEKPMTEYDEKKEGSVEKGIPDGSEMFCIRCPRGCRLSVAHDESGREMIQGNRCPRGLEFARQEMQCPMRVVTTTVKDAQGRLYPARSAAPVPLDKMREFVRSCGKIVIDPECAEREMPVEGFETGIRITV